MALGRRLTLPEKNSRIPRTWRKEAYMAVGQPTPVPTGKQSGQLSVLLKGVDLPPSRKTGREGA